MGPAFYIMAIFGCADDGAACHAVRVVDTRYVSADACTLATEAMLEKSSDISFPVVTAQCLPEKEVTVSAPHPPTRG